MEYNEMLELIERFIGNIGFPILACAFMAWTNYDQRKKHDEESHVLESAIHKLENAITSLTVYIMGESKGDSEDDIEIYEDIY